MPLSPDCVSRLAWLKTSGIQQTEGPDAGGVYAWIDETTGNRSFLYSEITGYFITIACHLARLDDKTYWTDRAIEAGNWIFNVALQKNGAVLTRKYNGINSDPFCFSRKLVAYFDCCMVGYGLVNLYELTADEKWLSGSIKIAEYCLDKFLSVNNLAQYPVSDELKGGHVQLVDHWSQNWGSFELKSSLFFSTLYKYTNHDEYKNVEEYLTPLALRAQKTKGNFATNGSQSTTHLHPHNYTIEALLFLHANRSDHRLLTHAQAAIDFIFERCLDPNHMMTHSWPGQDDYCGVSLRSDVIAQSLRCYYIAKILDPTYSREWEKNIPELHELIDSFSLESGGTSYGIREDGLLSPHANAWCHMFSLEMYLFRDYYEGGIKPERMIIT